MGSSFTPDNRFIVSLNDKPVNGHKRSVHKYSSHENSNEIDHEKQNKSLVQKKEHSDGNSTELKSSYLTHEMVSKPKTNLLKHQKE